MAKIMAYLLILFPISDCFVRVLVVHDVIFTYPLADLGTTKKHLNGQMQFVLVFKDR